MENHLLKIMVATAETEETKNVEYILHAKCYAYGGTVYVSQILVSLKHKQIIKPNTFASVAEQN